jgi:hypothetical protein
MEEVWAETPPHVGRGTGRYDWVDIVERLKARPGEWLLIDDSATLSLQTAIRKRKMVALRDDEWDFKVSIRDTDRDAGTCVVWMSAVKREDT